MLQSAFRQMKIKVFKIVIGKPSLKLLARVAWGSAGVVTFNRYMDFLTSLTGSSQESDKLFKRTRDILVEFIVLYSERTFDEEKMESIRDKIDTLMDRVEGEMPPGIGKSHAAELIRAEIRKPILERLLTDMTKMLIDELGEAFDPATIRKVRKVSEQLKQPEVLEQFCWFDSPSFAILDDAIELSDKLAPIEQEELVQKLENDAEANKLIKPFRRPLQILGLSD